MKNSRTQTGRILIYTHSWAPFADANTNALVPLLDALHHEYRVDVLCCNVTNKEPWFEEQQNVRVYRYENSSTLVAMESPKRASIPGSACNSVRRIARRVYRSVSPKKQSRETRHHASVTLDRITKENRYDILVTVTSPFQPQKVAGELAAKNSLRNRGTVWVPLFMDPYASYIGHKGPKDRLMSEEDSVYKMADAVVVTPEIYQENLSNQLLKYTQKTFALPLANLQVRETPAKSPMFLPGKINCLYAGSLQDVRVRNPEYLFRLISECDSDSIMFHMMVSTWSEETIRMRKEILTDATNVIWHEKTSLEVSLDAMLAADILINIGNECVNQLPSKVCDYVGSRRPIVNIYSQDEDTSKAFLERYPAHVDIRADAASIDAQVAALQLFCETRHLDIIPAELVRTRYADYLAENVASRFAAILSHVVNVPPASSVSIPMAKA